MTQPDELAEQLTPPPGRGPAYAAQLYVADGAMDLAERLLDAMPPGPPQTEAIGHLVRVARTAYSSIAPACRPTPADAPVPCALAERPAGHPDVGLPPALALDVGLWRLGVRTSGLHPLTRLVAFVLSDACGPSGTIPDAAQPTLRDLSEQACLPMSQLHSHLQDLAVQGWILRHTVLDSHGARLGTRYQLRLPSSPNPR